VIELNMPTARAAPMEEGGVMRILVTGAAEFIVAALRAAGCGPPGRVRHTHRRMVPDQESIASDFNRDVTIDARLPWLTGIGARAPLLVGREEEG
jgi:hypothetical protein